MARIRSSPSSSRFLLPNIIFPATIGPGGEGTNRIIESAVTLFPQPLSPTSANVRPCFTERETSCTACATPRSVKKSTESPLTSNNLLLSVIKLASNAGQSHPAGPHQQGYRPER